MDEEQDKSAVIEDQEWDTALDDFATEHGVKVDAAEDDTKKDAAQADADKVDPAEDDGKADDDEDKKEDEGADDGAADAELERARQLRESRGTQKELAAQENEMKSDIREQMFGDIPTKLTDADGDPIETIEDVMKLINPNTVTKDNPQGRNFSEEEAASFLLAASQHLAKKQEEVETQVAKIAEVNISLKDQVDIVKEKYGKFLADSKNHKLRDEVLQNYFKTLVRDPDTDIIVDAPVSMEWFYDQALKPHVEVEAKTSAAEAAAQAKLKEAARVAEENKKLKLRTDREDIFGRGEGRSALDPEDAEWADATKEYYGKR